MGLKIGQNINFRTFLVFPSVFGRDTVFLVVTKFPGHDSLLGRDSFWTATCFSSPTCHGHNLFVLTRIWACKDSLERYMNEEFNQGRI